MATLKIETKVDRNGKAQIRKLRGEVDQLGNSADKSQTSLKKMAAKIAGATATLYAMSSALRSVTTTGFKYNNSIEQSVQGLTALTVATSSNITSTGKQLTLQEKYNLATQESLVVMKQLLAINAETPHTLDQTNMIYKAMYVSMKKAGASTSDMINLTKKISIAAGAAGVEFNQLLAGVDGLATGSVLANSGLGMFLRSLDLSNKTLKESSDVVGLLNEKFAEFTAADTMGVAVSNLDNSWQQLTGTITKDIFSGTKKSITSLSKSINELMEDQRSMEVFTKNANTMSIGVVKSLGTISKAFIGTTSIISTTVAGWSMTISSFEAYFSRVGSAIDYWVARSKGDATAMEAALNKYNKTGDEWKESIAAQKRELDSLMAGNEKLVKGIDGAVLTFDKYIRASDKVVKANNNMGKSSGELVNKNGVTRPGTTKVAGAHFFKTSALGDIRAEAQLIKGAYSLITSDLNKINDQYGEMYEAVKDIFNEDQLKAFYAAWGKSIDDISKKSGKENEQVRGIFEDWSDQISKTLADGIQAGLDGTDFSDFASSLTESVGNSMTQAGLNSISSTVTSSGTSWEDVSGGDWITTAIGIVLMGITSAQKKSEAAEAELTASMDRLTSVNKELAQLGMGEGSKISGTFGQLDGLLSSLDSATGNLESFEPDFFQKMSEQDYVTGLGLEINAAQLTGKVFEQFDNYEYSSLKYLDDWNSKAKDKVRDWFGSDTDTDNLATKVNEAKIALSKWSIEVGNSLDALVNYGKQFGDMYDRLSGTDYFSDAAGKSALDSVTSTFGMDIEPLTKLLGESFNISNIDELKAGLALGDMSQENKDAMATASKLFESIGISEFSAVDAINMFDDIDTAVDYQIKLNKELADSYAETSAATEEMNLAIESALKALDSAYLGEYSPLSMLQKTDYANNAAYSSAASGATNAVDAAYIALQTAAKSATRDEDIAREFTNYTRLLETQVEDASRTDIVDAIGVLTSKVERLEDELAASREANAVA